jgi:hypothetical protein
MAAKHPRLRWRTSAAAGSGRIHSNHRDIDADGHGAGSGDARSQTMLVPGETARCHCADVLGHRDGVPRSIGKSLNVPLCDLLGTRSPRRGPIQRLPFLQACRGGGEGDDRREDEYGERSRQRDWSRRSGR